MTIEELELRQEVQKLGESIDFVMARFGDMSNQNKLYENIIGELQEELDAVHIAFKEYRKGVVSQGIAIAEADKMVVYWHGVFDGQVKENTELEKTLENANKFLTIKSKELTDLRNRLSVFEKLHQSLRGVIELPVIKE